MNYKLFLLCSIFLLALLFPVSGRMHRSSPGLTRVSACPTVILSSPDDPYYPVAEQIAGTEGLPVVHSLNEALDCQPGTLLWVVSPASLSDRVMVAYGTALKERGVWLSGGIITGSSLESARARGWPGKAAALLVASLPFWFSGLFILGGLALVNQLMVHPEIGTSLWNANMAWTAWISFGVLALLMWSVFAAARSLIRKEA